MKYKVSRGEAILNEIFAAISSDRDRESPSSGEHYWSWLYINPHCPDRLRGITGTVCIRKKWSPREDGKVKPAPCCCPCPRVLAAIIVIDKEKRPEEKK